MIGDYSIAYICREHNLEDLKWTDFENRIAGFEVNIGRFANLYRVWLLGRVRLTNEYFDRGKLKECIYMLTVYDNEITRGEVNDKIEALHATVKNTLLDDIIKGVDISKKYLPKSSKHIYDSIEKIREEVIYGPDYSVDMIISVPRNGYHKVLGGIYELVNEVFQKIILEFINIYFTDKKYYTSRQKPFELKSIGIAGIPRDEIKDEELVEIVEKLNINRILK